MTPWARWAVLVGLVVALALAAVVAGRPGDLAPVVGTQRLGPESGEPVADYLLRAGASLPAGDSSHSPYSSYWALVQPRGYLTPVAAAELAQGVRLSRVVFRVPLPRVQTALVIRDLPGQQPVAELTGALRSAAQDRAVASQRIPGSRAAAIAAAEAGQLRAGCACVLALLVLGDGAALQAVAVRPGVRAVHVADPGTPLRDIVISPLLPEQIDLAGPVPDDGPVPP